MDDIKTEIDKVIRDENASLKQKRLLLKELRGLVSTPGWLYIQRVLQSQADMRYTSIGRMLPRSVEDVLEQTGLRGEASGMEILISLPDNLIASLEADVEASAQPTKEEEQNDDDGENLGG